MQNERDSKYVLPRPRSVNEGAANSENTFRDMMLIAQLTHDTGSPDLMIGYLAVMALVACGIWALIRWLLGGSPRPDPWDEQTAAEIAGDEATPLCHRCLCPNPPLADFCLECGAPIGKYTNLLPFPQLFSIGHTLRIGTAGNFRHSPVTISGFILLGLAEYSLFAPVYWFMFLRTLFRQRRSEPPADLPPPKPPPEGC